MKEEILKGGSLDGESIPLGGAFSVFYDSPDTNRIKTEFTIVPLNGKITLKYVDGVYDILHVNLYDTRSDEYIQCGTITKKDKYIVFSNLSGAYSYYFEIEFDDTNEDSGIVLGFSG